MPVLSEVVEDLRKKYTQESTGGEQMVNLRIATLDLLVAQMNSTHASLEETAELIGKNAIVKSTTEYRGGMPDARPVIVTSTMSDVLNAMKE